MRLYLIALQFLTIIPLPFDTHCQKDDLGRSTALFPLVGLTIGTLLVGLNWLVAPWLTRPLCDALLVTTLTAVTGGLHLDGMADVCDGLAARGGRERFLAVMKDSQVGAIGAVGLVLGLLLKWQALVALPVDLKWQALLLFPTLARFGQVLMMTGARHARQDGLGIIFVQGTSTVGLAFSLITAATASFFLLDLRGFVVLTAVCLLTAAGRLFFQHRLGGITGDTLGCLNELNEILTLIGISIAAQLTFS
jgi:adenosylcobinamide-GDP ribazoletransferase